MRDATTFDALAEHAAAYFYGALKATEDFDSFERTVGSETKRLARASMAACVERFDSELAAELPASWRLKGKPSKTVLTVLGPVTYRRSLYVDRDGLARYPADELLGIPKGQRMSADAFVWIARRCAVVSYRRAAADFAEMSGHSVSAMRCWRVVQREAELIRAELASAPPGEISQLDVYAECDGLHVALQSPERRKEAISRFLYEQSRKKSSVEMKVGCVYAGVREERGRRRVRGNVALFATCGSAEDFRAGMRATVEADYAAGDIETIHFASDGGSWCTDHGLDGLAENIDQGLDMFHVLKKTVRAFPEGAGRERMFSLALRKRPEAFAEACRRILPQLHGRRRERVRELAAYVGGHADLLRGTSLGTMEATNAYAWAKRMKSFGCSWSRAGAESMATVLSRTAAHRDLVPPPKDAFLTAPELSRIGAAAAARGEEAARQEAVGAGWLPPSAGFPLAGFEASFLPTSWKRRFVR